MPVSGNENTDELFKHGEKGSNDIPTGEFSPLPLYQFSVKTHSKNVNKQKSYGYVSNIIIRPLNRLG